MENQTPEVLAEDEPEAKSAAVDTLSSVEHSLYAYTYHADGEPWVTYEFTIKIRWHYRTVVYPDRNNMGVPVSNVEPHVFEGKRYYYVKYLPAEDASHGIDEIALYLNRTDTDGVKVYDSTATSSSATLIREQRCALINEIKDDWINISVKDDDGKDISGWISCRLRNGIERYNAFTEHKPHEVVYFYADKELREKRMAIYPYMVEGNVGTNVWVTGKVGDGVLEMEYSGEKMYCRVGDLFVFLRGVDKAVYSLFSAPDKESDVIAKAIGPQTVVVLDVNGSWLRVRALTEQGEYSEGWIPRNYYRANFWW